MHARRIVPLVMVISVMTFLGINVLGCATSSKVKELELQTQKALETAEEALKEAKNARAMIDDLSEVKADVSENAAKAENAASRAEKASEDAMESANRAEDSEKNCRKIYERITSK